MAAQQQHQQLWLKDMDFSQQDLQLLQNQNLHNARDLLIQSPIDLVERLNIPISQAQRILQHTAMQVAPPYVTAMELHSTLHMHSVKLLTGLPALDDALRIGVPPAAITELVGPASVGKSQFCYTLTLQAALPQTLGGLAAPVLYIDTEGKFSSDRIKEMIIARLATAPASTLAAAGAALSTAGAAATAAGGAVDPTEDILDQTLNRVLIVKAHTPEELNTWLNRLSQTVAQRDVKLIVLDSIAALLRTEFGGGEAAALAARGEMLGQQAALLKAVAEANRIPVVVTNQVTARMTGPAVHSFQQPQHLNPAAGNAVMTSTSSTEGQVWAALGTKWAHAVNVRLVLERKGNSRVITIAKSPLSANVAVEYTVTPGGVQQAPDTEGQAAVLVAPHSALDLAIANAPPG